MTRRPTLLALVLGVAALSATATLSPRAQTTSPPARASVQDALLQPFDFAFAKDTPLSEVAATLGKSLGIHVVLDRAAMNRLDVLPDDTVQLELKGVRLKTGLRLLLDQLDMTFRVEPEDNLLVLTDATGAGDAVDRVLSEVESLHHDVHALQDAVDDVRGAMGLDEGDRERLRKPTIIEEMPQENEAAPKAKPPADKPAPRPRTAPEVRKPA